MARCGMPDDTSRCPDCGEIMHYNAATRGYLHVLATICPARDDALADDDYPNALATICPARDDALADDDYPNALYEWSQGMRP